MPSERPHLGSIEFSRCRNMWAALVAAALLSLLLAAGASAGHSILTQKPGAAGCIAEAGTNEACTDGTALHGAGSVAVSPDGTNVYVATQDSDAVTIFDRDGSTGALTQKPGTAGCISETGTFGACLDGKALDSAETVTVSPDGTSVYVGSRLSDAIAVFDRNMATGELTQKAGHRRLHLRDRHSRSLHRRHRARRRFHGHGLARWRQRLRRLPVQRRRRDLRSQHHNRCSDSETRHRRLHLRGRHGRSLR